MSVFNRIAVTACSITDAARYDCIFGGARLLTGRPGIPLGLGLAPRADKFPHETGLILPSRFCILPLL
jgi:hypothetical protein